MKIRIPFLFLTIIFLAIFLVFYKGLQNSNIYVPNNNIEKELPNFKAQLFDKDSEILLKDQFMTMNLVQSQDYFNIRYQNKPFMVWIWLSVLLITFGALISLFRKKHEN